MGQIGISRIQALLQTLAELALHTEDSTAYRHAWLSQLGAYFSVDAAAVVTSCERKVYSTTTYRVDPKLLSANAAEYFAEFTTRERSRSTCRTTLRDDALFSASRRQELRLYQDYLLPLGMQCSAVHAWKRDGTLFFVLLSRRQASAAFEADELRALDSALGIVALGESLHAHYRQVERSSSLPVLENLTPAEATVVALAQRGLTNNQIATLCAVRPQTASNQLSSAFRKLRVSNRTELAYLLSRGR